MKTARSGSSPIPSISRSASKLCSWRPKALRRARGVDQAEVLVVADDHPGAGAEDRPPRLVVGADRRLEARRLDPLRDRRALAAGDDEPVEVLEVGRGRGPRSTLAPSWRSIRRVGLEVALDREDADRVRRQAPRSCSSASARGQLGDLEPGHRLAEPDRGGGDPLGVLEVGGRLDDRAGAALGVGALEDAGADEVALGAELHHQRRVGRGGDAAGAEQRHRQATRRRRPRARPRAAPGAPWRPPAAPPGRAARGA